MVRQKQRRILIVERSRTLRQSIRALLSQATDIKLELDAVETFELGLRRLQASPGAYDAVMLDWPAVTTDASDALLLMLTEPSLHSTFVQVLSHDRTPGARSWVGQRPNTAYTLWDDPDEVVMTLKHGLSGVAGDSSGTSALNTLDRPANALRFLLVDDSASSRVFFRRLLGSRGYEVDTAASVTEAREKLRRRHFDVALIDFYLPEIHGDVFVREIKADPATQLITCAIITGAYSDHLIRECLDAGAVECLFKNEAGELFLSQVDAIARTVRDSRTLYEKEQLLDGILDSVGEAVFGVDQEDRVAFANARAIAMLGFDEEAQITGMDADSLFLHNSADQKTAGIAWMQMAYAARGFLRPVARQMSRRDGKVVDVTASVYPLRIRDREIGTVVSVREVTTDRSLERQAWWHAIHDVETGVLNRRYFEVQIESEVHQLRRTEARHALLVVALESARIDESSNDAGVAADSDAVSHSGAANGLTNRICRPVPYDHQLIGPRLREVANMLVERARTSDIVAYMGGGRFGVLLRDADPQYASSIQAGFRTLLERTVHDHRGISASAGIAVLDRTICSANEIIALASLAQTVASGKLTEGIAFHLAETVADQDDADV